MGNSQIRSLLENAIDPTSKFEWMLPLLAPLIYGGLVGPIILASVLAIKSSLRERFALSVGAAVGALPLLSPFPMFLIVNGFALDAVMRGDRLGISRETLAQIPHGPQWIARVWRMYGMLASWCGRAPGQLRRVGQLMTG